MNAFLVILEVLCSKNVFFQVYLEEPEPLAREAPLVLQETEAVLVQLGLPEVGVLSVPLV